MNIVLIGDGGHGKVVRDLILLHRNYNLVALLDDKYKGTFTKDNVIFGPISSVDQIIKLYSDVKFVITIGDNKVRRDIVHKLNFPKNYYATLIHPTATISPSVMIGHGSVFMANVVIDANSRIGDHVIINTSSVVEHDNNIEDFVHLSPNATLTGAVHIEKGVHIGAGATVIPNKKIGKWAVIGAGAAVINSIPENSTAVGVPAKVKITHKMEEVLVKKLEKKEKVLLSPPHLTGNEWKYIQEAIDSNWIAPLGPHVDAFEKEMASYLGISDAIAVSSGTAAIHLALSLLGVGKGDTVFCSTLTFVASANPILYQGANPVFIDSEPDTWNMSPDALEKAFREALLSGNLPKAVIVVNLYGQSAKMDEILVICNRYNVPFIEDAAESLGSEYKGKKSGTFGKFGIFSFNGNKIVTTSGGGMLVSDDVEAIQKARFLATQAKDPAPYYQHSKMGYNYRMSNILAGIGRAQLQVLKERVDAKRLVFSKYYNELSDLPGIHFMPELEDTLSNRWLTTLTIDEKITGISAAEFIQFFAEDNIEARHVWKPLHLQPLFQESKFYSHQEHTSISEELFMNGICLPSGSNMANHEQMRVIESLKKAMAKRMKMTHPIPG